MASFANCDFWVATKFRFPNYKIRCYKAENRRAVRERLQMTKWVLYFLKNG